MPAGAVAGRLLNRMIVTMAATMDSEYRGMMQSRTTRSNHQKWQQQRRQSEFGIDNRTQHDCQAISALGGPTTCQLTCPGGSVNLIRINPAISRRRLLDLQSSSPFQGGCNGRIVRQ